ncbi:MAG: hypothetical protein C0605_05755 [Hyphomicrobiales bacterium]|nr:MAG: hypothetical protein C0605_05755 [Hyphomicrobiales bacterium]
MQRLCQDGKIDCYRLKTSRNGTAVTEWLVNGSSLSRHIEKNEKKIQAGESSLRPVATPTPNGDAKIKSGDANSNESEVKSADAINAVATPEQSGYANNDEEVEKTTDVISDLATPTESGDARIEKGEIASMMSEAKDPAPARGEQTFVQSTEVTALIEKAELLAKSEMKDEIISGLRKDKADLKELVEDHRANEKRLQQDLKDMATNAINQTLNTLQNIALGGKLTPNASATGQGDQSDHKLDNPQLRGKHDGV